MQPPQEHKRLLRKELLYIIPFILVVFVLAGTLVILNVLNKGSLQGAEEYVEGLDKDQAVIGVIDKIIGLYPRIPYEVDAVSLSSNIFEGLTALRNGKVVPALAESWSNPDNLTWRIKLRQARFHNGQPLKASDVKFTIEEAKKDPDWTAGFIASRISEAKVIDENTLELKTVNPDPTLMYWMIFFFILSEDQVKSDGLEKAVGTGPYKLSSFSDKEVVLTANKSYWGGPPKVKKLIYKALPDEKSLAAAVREGKVDIAYVVQKDLAQDNGGGNSRTIRALFSDVTTIGFDTRAGKSKYIDSATNPFADVRVRKALLLALDVEKILKASKREGKALTQIGLPELIGFNQSLRRPKPDKLAAKNLLAEAGYPDGFTVVFDVTDIASKAAEEIKAQLSEIGIRVNIRAEKYSDNIKRITSGDTSFFWFVYLPDTLDSIDLLNTLVHTPDNKGNGSANVGGYSNKEIDELLDKASVEFDVRSRSVLAAEAHKKIMDDLPYIPMYTRAFYLMVSNDLAFKPAPFGYIFGIDLSGRAKLETQAN